jgi:hypothetical protein
VPIAALLSFEAVRSIKQEKAGDEKWPTSKLA